MIRTGLLSWRGKTMIFLNALTRLRKRDTQTSGKRRRRGTGKRDRHQGRREKNKYRRINNNLLHFLSLVEKTRERGDG